MKFRSVNQKLLKSVFMVSVILAIVTAVGSFVMELDRTKTQMVMMINQLLDTVEDTAAIAAYSRNKQIADDVLRGLLKNDIIYKAHFISGSDFHLEQSKNYETKDETPIKRFLVSPFGDGEILGYLLVQPTAQFQLIEAKHSAIANTLTSIFIIAFTAITIFLIIQSNISKPLTHVSNTLHAIKVGKEQRISVLKKHRNDELGHLVGDINTLLEVLENKYINERTLRKKVESIEQKLRDIYNSTSAGLFLVDEKGSLLTFNKTLETILERTTFSIPQQNSLLSPYFHESNAFNTLISEVIKSGQLKAQDFSLRVPKDTDLIWVHCLLSKVTDEEGQTHIEGVFFDVTKRVENEKAAAYEANHDKLTGLLRRQACQKHYEDFKKTVVTLRSSFLFLDLDGFKQANDTHGHLAGDKVLSITSERLVKCVRDTDLVCRLGGDEFLVILLDCSKDNVIRIAKSILSSIQKNISVDNTTNIKVGVSIGITHSDKKNKNDFDDLVQAADEAMYEVKRQGKNGYCITGSEDKIYNA
ncbi:MAG: diguanylate cyclase [Methylomarinum sp.]|nr:diguanylate cyclase [Methylomarinum sp.]